MPRLCSQAMTEACLDRSQQPGKTFCPLCTATSTNSTGICDFGPNNSFHPEPRCGASWAEVSKLRSDRQLWASFTGLPSRDCSQMRDPCTPKLGGKVPVWLRRKGGLGQERRKERRKKKKELSWVGHVLGPRWEGNMTSSASGVPAPLEGLSPSPSFPATLQIPVKPLTPRAQGHTKLRESHSQTIFVSQRLYLKGCSKSELSGQRGLSQEVPQAGPRQLSLTMTVILPLPSRGLPSSRGQ